MSIIHGDIVWAEVPDPKGYKKDRPLVVIGVDDDLTLPLICCCVTTTDKDPRPQSYMRIPWDSSGRSSSGLREPSFAVATWIVEIKREEIRRTCGRLKPANLKRLLDLIAATAH